MADTPDPILGLLSGYGWAVLVFYMVIREGLPVLLRILETGTTAGRQKKVKEDEHKQALENRELQAMEKIAQSLEVATRVLAEQKIMIEQMGGRLAHLEAQQAQVAASVGVLVDRTSTHPNLSPRNRPRRSTTNTTND